jgi:SNF2 family DNA or RNA helicase
MAGLFAEISEDGRWVEIFFDAFGADGENLLQSVHSAGCTFIPKTSSHYGSAFWRTDLDYYAVKLLTDRVGWEHVTLGDALRVWGQQEKERLAMVHALVHAEDAELERVPDLLPEMYKKLRPDQRAGIAYLSFVRNTLNADQMGLGKTWENIAACFEAGTDNGPNLVVCPLTAIEPVWLDELTAYQPHMVLIGNEQGWKPERRLQVQEEAKWAISAGIPFWFVINYDMIRLRKSELAGLDGKPALQSAYPFIHETEWNNVILDEPAKNGMRNPDSPSFKGMVKLKVAPGGLRIPASGTPAGGKTKNMWPMLHFIDPERHSSRWRWYERWLEMVSNGYGVEPGDVREDRQSLFDLSLEPYMLRRLKEDVLKDLPPKDRHDVWCRMTPGQALQYKKFARDAEIKIGEEDLSATSILAEYTRLKQFADAKQEIRDGKLIPTSDSGKLQMLVEKLTELGIMDGEGDQQAIIASQFETVIKMVYEYLSAKGVPTLMITGKVKGKERTAAKRNFQAGEARVVCIQSITGGVALTLDRADTVHILDETWDPDDQEQVEDRAHRASRIHQVTVFYYISRGTVEQYIRETTDEKRRVNNQVLNGRRKVKLY